jgi:hypothetical protein
METFGVQLCRWSCTVRSLRWLLKVKTAGHWELLCRVPAVCAGSAPGSNRVFMVQRCAIPVLLYLKVVLEPFYWIQMQLARSFQGSCGGRSGEINGERAETMGRPPPRD